MFDDAAASYEESSNPYTLGRRADTLAALVQGRSLELGGGTAAVTSRLADRSRAIHSDIAPAMCRIAHSKVGCPSVCFDAQWIPIADASIDTAIASEMIYYLSEPERFVREAYRVLRPGGKLLMSTTNPAAAILDRGRACLRRLGFRGMFFDDGSPRFLRLRDVKDMLQHAGFVVERTWNILPLPFAALDRLNRLLERTPIARWGLFMMIAARKP